MTTPAPDWDPDLYARFRDLRSRPFWDLAALLETATDEHSSPPVTSMVDLGCGSGELTVELAGRLGVRLAEGIDSSPAMLARAVEHARETGSDVTFSRGDIATWTGTGIDVLIANASLHWVADHRTVLERWADSLAPSGQLAVQVPANADHPAHLCSVEVAHREPYLTAFGGSPPPDPVAANVLRPEEYSEVLHDLGFGDPHVRLQVYPQPMPSTDHVVDWVSGSSLTRFFKLLPEDLQAGFLADYRRALIAAVGDRSPYFYTFKRILMWGRRD